MLPAKPQFKNYGVRATAGTDLRPVPAVASNNTRRVFLEMQNTGPNPVIYHFSEPVQGGGADFVLLAYERVTYDIPDTCPDGAINVRSVLGTTMVILEGIAVG